MLLSAKVDYTRVDRHLEWVPKARRPSFPTRQPALDSGRSAERPFDASRTLDYLAVVIKMPRPATRPLPTMILARNSLAAARRLSARAALSGLAAGLLVAAGPASAVLYKWVDANGRVS